MTAAAARQIKSEMDWDPDHNRQYTSEYEVITDDKNDGPITAVGAPGIPSYRSSYQWGNDFDNWAFAHHAHANCRNPDETRRLWTVVITHSTRPSFRCGDFRIENPLSEPIRLSGSFMQFTRAALKDKDGKALLNSVDEPFTPPIEVDDSRKVLVMQKNTAAISLSSWADYNDTVNAGPMWGLLRRAIKLNQWRWTVQYYGTCNAYIANEWELHIDLRTAWTHKPLDAGFRYLPAEAVRPNYETILIKDVPRHLATPLNGAGAIVDLVTNPAAAFFHTFAIYEERDFTAIGIPSTLPGPFI